MSSDNRFTALGPAIVGFQTDSASIDRGAEITSNQVGVKGICGGSVGDGVQGFGTGNFSGVAGFAGGDDNSAGTGVIGFGGVQTGQVFVPALGPGVRGIGGKRGGGNNTSPFPLGIGVYGQGGGPTAPGVDGSLDVTGTKSAVVPFPDGSHRRLYCMETPESWFEDFGLGQLENGQAEITLDPDFVAVVNSGDYHVFITEYEDNNALYVTQRTNTGFGVRAKASTASSVFSFRVVAKRKDIPGPRFEKVPLRAENVRGCQVGVYQSSYCRRAARPGASLNHGSRVSKLLIK